MVNKGKKTEIMTKMSQKSNKRSEKIWLVRSKKFWKKVSQKKWPFLFFKSAPVIFRGGIFSTPPPLKIPVGNPAAPISW